MQNQTEASLDEEIVGILETKESLMTNPIPLSG